MAPHRSDVDVNPRTLLRERCIKEGGFAAVARKIGCTRQALSQIASERRKNLVKPSRELANKIAAHLNISPTLWDSFDGESAA